VCVVFFDEMRKQKKDYFWTVCRVLEVTNTPKKHVLMAHHRHGNFGLPSARAVLGEIFAECPQIDIQQSRLCRLIFFPISLCRVLHLANRLLSVYWSLAVVSSSEVSV
jgi:hypothetical protein